MKSTSTTHTLRYKKSKEQAHSLKYKTKRKIDKFGAHVLRTKRKKRIAFSPGKAKEILGESKPTLRGHAITPRQRRWLGWQAGGAKPRRKGLLNRMKKYKQGSGKRFQIFKKSFA